MPKPNKNMTKRELALIQGAIRRTFARSEVYAKSVQRQRINHSDKTRPRVRTWYKCANCGKPGAKGDFQNDHIDTVVPLDSSFEKLSWDQWIENIWCDVKNLWFICLQCHEEKTKIEKGIRAKIKNGVKV